MFVIHKYPLEVRDGHQAVFIPHGARVLSVQFQRAALHLWALHFIPKVGFPKKSSRLFVVVGTGQPFDATFLIHVGTVQDGTFVWHVFEDVEQEPGSVSPPPTGSKGVS